MMGRERREMVKKHLIWLIAVLFVLVMACGQQKPEPTKETGLTVTVETIDSMQIASVSMVGPYSGIDDAMGTLMAWVGQNKVKPSGAPFGVYYDDPAKVNPDSTKYEVCVPVPAGTKGDKQVVVKKFGPAEIASTIYVGPYDKVGPVYAKLAEWITKNSYTIMGPAHEFYLNDPAKVPADSLQTKIAFPVTSTAP
jgi:AraC family transcriptional regulator